MTLRHRRGIDPQTVFPLLKSKMQNVYVNVIITVIFFSKIKSNSCFFLNEIIDEGVFSNTLTLTVTFRGFSELQVDHVRHLHLQGALRAEQEQQRAVVLHLLRHDAERGKHLTELQDKPESRSASPGRLLLQGIPAPAHQPAW